MTGTPPAEADIDEPLLRRLLAEQAPEFADLPLSFLANGWDNAVWRLGDDHAVRITRRAAAASFNAQEQIWLPVLAPTLPLPVPAAIIAGRPSEAFPWCWSVVPWFEGVRAEHEPPRPSEAATLGRFLRALHISAPEDAPDNPLRGVPLADRSSAVEGWLALHHEGAEGPLVQAAAAVFATAANIRPSEQRVWLHGDLHPRNVLVRDGAFAAILDWGDMTAGDPATDLSAAWWFFENEHHADLCAGYGSVDPDTWTRARGWAAFFGLAFLDFGLASDHDRPDLAAQRLARRQLRRVVGERQTGLKESEPET